MASAGNTLRRITGLVGAMLLLAGVYWSARFGRADHLAIQGTAADLQAAVELAPMNARYLLRLADLREHAGESIEQVIDRALEADPRDATVRIRAALRAEVLGDYPRAEALLLEAARLSRQYDPRWALANFYFRRGEQEEFWKWAGSAAEWAYGDRTPLFQLMWEMTDDADFILRRGVPETVDALLPYLEFTLRTNRLQAAERAAKRLVLFGESRTSAALLWYVSRTLETKSPFPGMEVWNEMCSRKLLPYERLDVSHGSHLTNGNFRRKPLDSGFDWRFPSVPGVATLFSQDPPAARFSFSGRQPEHCELLAQSAPVAPERGYALEFEYRTEGIKPDTGLRWKIFDAVAGTELPLEAAHLASDEWTRGTAAFKTPAGTRWVRLALSYGRAPGTTRIEGSISLRLVSLSERPGNELRGDRAR